MSTGLISPSFKNYILKRIYCQSSVENGFRNVPNGFSKIIGNVEKCFEKLFALVSSQVAHSIVYKTISSQLAGTTRAAQNSNSKLYEMSAASECPPSRPAAATAQWDGGA